MPPFAISRPVSSPLPITYGPVLPHRVFDRSRRWWCAEARSEPSPVAPEARPLPRTEEAARRADALAVSLRGALDRATAPLARSALAFLEAEGWREMGYARLEDHARERFARSGRWVRDLAALGRMFSTLPGLEEAVCGTAGGAPLGRVAGLLIGRVASPETLSAWAAHARAVSVRELKRDVAEASPAGPAWPPGMGGDREEASPGGAGARAGGGAVESQGVRLPENPEDDPSERSLAGIELPSAVRAAFDEALDLFRAVEGREATITSFADALVAEAAASGRFSECAGGAFLRGLTAGESIAARERAHAVATNLWEHLPEPGVTTWALRLAGSSLERLREAAAVAGCGGPVALDGQIRQMLALENEIESRLAALMAQMADVGAWSRLGFDSAVHYAEQRLGMRRSAARMRVRVTRALRGAPLLREAYERGEIGMEAAWLVSRMMGAGPADSEGGRAWVERARLASVKRLRDEFRLAELRAAGLQVVANDPGDSSSPTGSSRHECRTRPRRPTSDADWFAGLHRDAGTAWRRIAALGRLAARDPRSDVFLTLRLPRELATAFLGAIDAERRELERQVAEIPWEESWPDPDAPGSVLAARAFFVRCRGTPAWVGLLALLEDFVRTWDVEPNVARRPGRSVFARYGWRCAAPGCTSRRNLENHHIEYRSRGGGEEESNRTPLCRFHHHWGEHGGLASCRGRAPLEVTWTLGRHACGGKFRNEIRI